MLCQTNLESSFDRESYMYVAWNHEYIYEVSLCVLQLLRVRFSLIKELVLHFESYIEYHLGFCQYTSKTFKVMLKRLVKKNLTTSNLSPTGYFRFKYISILNTNWNVIKAMSLYMKLDLNFLFWGSETFLIKQYLS